MTEVKKQISKMPPVFWLIFYIFVLLITLPVLAYIGVISQGAPGSLTVTINQKSGTDDPNPSYTSVYEVVFSEPIDESTFTDTDITLAGTAPGQAVQSITESGTFNQTTYDLRIEAATAGTITPSIAQELIATADNPTNTNNTSTSTDNSVTYDGTYLPNEFVITIKSDGDYIRTPADFTYGTIYNYDVDWDNDGTYDQFGLTAYENHYVGVVADYTIRIKGLFPRVIAIGYDISVNQWGTNQWSSMGDAFRSADNVVFNSYDAPDLSLVTDMSYAFEGSEFNSNINHWDVSGVENMSSAFAGTSVFNQPLNGWDVSGVTDMNHMFDSAEVFNQPLNDWDVSSVNNMDSMFSWATLFNQPLNSWDTSNVTSMNRMFSYTSAFNQPLNNWDVSSVIDMHGMFDSAEVFDQPLNDWDVSNVQLMGAMFEFSNFNHPLNNWDVSSVINMSGMFYSNTAFNQPLNNWTTTSLIDTNQMFYGAASFNQPLDNWNVSNVINMALMFTSATSFNQPLNNWDVSNVQAMYGMFGLNSFNQPLDNWDTSSLVDVSSMFYGNTEFDQSLANWDMSNVTNATDMFANGAGLSTTNYDATLLGWSAQTLQSGLTFEAGTSIYCNAIAARQDIISSYSWMINDSGENCLEVETGYVGGDFYYTLLGYFEGVLENPGNYGDVVLGFEYGETEDYGMQVAYDGQMYAGNTFRSVEVELECGTSYHYRAFASDSSGVTVYGSDQTTGTNLCQTDVSLSVSLLESGPIKSGDEVSYHFTIGNEGPNNLYGAYYFYIMLPNEFTAESIQASISEPGIYSEYLLYEVDDLLPGSGILNNIYKYSGQQLMLAQYGCCLPDSPRLITVGEQDEGFIVKGTASGDYIDGETTIRGWVQSPYEDPDLDPYLLAVQQEETDYDLFTLPYNNVATHTYNYSEGGPNEPNQHPTVSLTAPENNYHFPTETSSVDIAANASDSDGTISTVRFYLDDVYIGEDTTAPYNFTATNLSPGDYRVKAVAQDNEGAQTTSSPHGFTILAPGEPTPNWVC